MENAHKLKFRSPSFFQRLKGMLGVDFYRLFHTPMFYIFLLIAAIIPAMVLGMTSMPSADGTETVPLYTNTWQVIAAQTPLYVVNSISEYANMNMVFIFGGIMVSIFIGHDYKSGYVKQLFTTHANLWAAHLCCLPFLRAPVWVAPFRACPLTPALPA